MPRGNIKTKIEWFVVNRVREMWILHKMTQAEIAVHLGISQGLVGHIESSHFIAKYGIKQLNKLIKVFKCSPRDFLLEKLL